MCSLPTSWLSGSIVIFVEPFDVFEKEESQKTQVVLLLIHCLESCFISSLPSALTFLGETCSSESIQLLEESCCRDRFTMNHSKMKFYLKTVSDL